VSKRSLLRRATAFATACVLSMAVPCWALADGEATTVTDSAPLGSTQIVVEPAKPDITVEPAKPDITVEPVKPTVVNTTPGVDSATIASAVIAALAGLAGAGLGAGVTAWHTRMHGVA